jgi:hypothetical protein
MLSQRSPIPIPPIPYPPTPPFWPWCSPVLGHIKFASPMGLSLQWWPTRPSFDTYAAKDKSSRVLVSLYCCSTYRVAVPFSSFGTFSSSSIGGRVIHPIADCDHPLLYLPDSGIVTYETAITGSLQQHLKLWFCFLEIFCSCKTWLFPKWIDFFFFFFKIHLFIICKYSVVVFRRTRRGRQVSLWMVVSHHVGCWDLNSGPLEEQSVLLTAEPSHQPRFLSFHWLLWIYITGS